MAGLDIAMSTSFRVGFEVVYNSPSGLSTDCTVPQLRIARVVNSESVSPDGWYYGPEVSERFDAPASFKDREGAVR
jgi:hypothetical protein